MSDPQTVTATALRAITCDEAFATTLNQLLTASHQLNTHEVGSGQNGRGSAEVIGFQVQIDNPRDRVLRNRSRLLNPVTAVARFVWMISGSDRLEDIAFYEPKVRHYTDNGLSVPGSNYGMRLFQPRPGVNQVEGVIDRLRSEVGSRRTAAVIWTGEDAVRDSRDIPCAFGVFYHARGDQLIASTIMRSNNAYLLMPYNTFEFGLLAELIASSVGLGLGPLLHYAASMHLFDEDRERAQHVVNIFNDELADAPSQPMPPMPRDPSPLEQAYKLAHLEAQLRHDHTNLHEQNNQALLARAASELDPYWLSFYRVLLCQALLRADRIDSARRVCQDLPEYFRSGVANLIDKATPLQQPKSKSKQLTFADSTTSDARTSSHVIVGDVYAPTVPEERLAVEELESILDGIEESDGGKVTRVESRILRRRLVIDRPVAPAARSENDGTANAADRKRLSVDDVRSALAELRSAQKP